MEPNPTNPFKNGSEANHSWSIENNTLAFKGRNFTKKISCKLIDEKSWKAPSELVGLTSRVKVKIGDDEQTIRVWNASFGRLFGIAKMKGISKNHIKIINQMGHFVSSEDEFNRLLSKAKKLKISSSCLFPLQQAYNAIYDTIKITKSAEGELQFEACQSHYRIGTNELSSIINRNLNMEKSFRGNLSKLITITNGFPEQAL